MSAQYNIRKLNKSIYLRVTEQEHKYLETVARENGLTMSYILRWRLARTGPPFGPTDKHDGNAVE